MAESVRAREHRANTELLDAELPDRRYADSAYLRWLYDENPLGEAFFAGADEPDEQGRPIRMAHYAVVPQRYRSGGETHPFVFSLHAVTRRTAQRRGYFSSLGEQIYEEARRWGALGVIGVSNDNSTPPVVKRLGFRLMGPLPVHVLVPPPLRGTGYEGHPVTDVLLAAPWFEELWCIPDPSGDQGWVNDWTPETIRWRLAAPGCGPYVVHVGDGAVAVSTTDRFRGWPVAVILKVRAHARSRPGEAARLVSAVCRYHGTPAAVYAGFNRSFPLRGLRPPRRLQPSPLNLIYRSLDPRVPKETFVLDTFEFLDMDAY